MLFQNFVGPYWINYATLKRKIKREIRPSVAESSAIDVNTTSTNKRLVNSAPEVEFFKMLREEIKKTSIFYSSAEELFRIRHRRVCSAFAMLQANPLAHPHDTNTWTRLLTACVKLYRDVLMMENFAISNCT